MTQQQKGITVGKEQGRCGDRKEKPKPVLERRRRGKRAEEEKEKEKMETESGRMKGA